MKWKKLRRKAPTFRWGNGDTLLVKHRHRFFWTLEFLGLEFTLYHESDDDDDELDPKAAKELAEKRMGEEITDRAFAAWSRWADESRENDDAWISALENASDTCHEQGEPQDGPEFASYAVGTAEMMAAESDREGPTNEELLRDHREIDQYDDEEEE